MRKILKVMGVVAICAAFAVVVYNQVNAKQDNSILAKNIEALSQGEDSNWENKRLRWVDCICADNKKGITARCRLDGNFEKCSSTQQGMVGCYKATPFTGVNMICEEAKSYDGE